MMWCLKVGSGCKIEFKPMFSIIIPLYNKSAYIGKCLQSVFNQTFTAFEVIVVNDGSTDASLEIVKNLNVPDTQKLQVINQINSGVSTARNNGVKAAKYDYIAFLDADDWWDPTYLSEMNYLIEAFPEAAIYGSNYNLIKSGISRLATVGVEPSYTKGLIDYIQIYAKTLCMPLWTCTTVIRKETFKSENGFNPILKLGEDFDLWVRVALKYSVAFLNKPLANYNQDVDITNRAVGNLHKPANHMLWNIDYLYEAELNNPDLKLLLDKLRVYNLFPYYISKAYHNLTKPELAKVDWSRQPSNAKLKYSMPVWILRAWAESMSLGSRVKQNLIRSGVKFN